MKKNLSNQEMKNIFGGSYYERRSITGWDGGGSGLAGEALKNLGRWIASWFGW